MKKFLAFAAVSALLVSLASCNNDDGGPTTEFNQLKITAADLPASFTLGALEEIPITYELPDDCTRFDSFQLLTPLDTVREVVVIGARRDNGACNPTATEATETLIFQVLFDITYTFKFWQGDDAQGNPQYLEVNVPVE